jgi:hypothetical protein
MTPQNNYNRKFAWHSHRVICHEMAMDIMPAHGFKKYGSQKLVA